MEFQILSSSLERRGTERADDMSDGYFGKFGEEEESNSSAAGKSGHAKLCARGHWRPAEDAKLKELVAQYGPQNWNLIAENLQGRSGN